MKKNSWYEVNIDVSNALDTNFQWPTHSKNQPTLECWGYNPSAILNKDWIEYTRSLGLELGFIQLFWKRSNLVQDTAHIDVYDGNKSQPWPFALNWTVFGGEGSTMLWYHLPDKNFTIKYSSANTPYADWKISELTECDRHNVGKKLTLVRTGIPHDVNTGSQERWCISARLKNVADTSWGQIVEDLRSKKLLVERNNE
jgi:hypothetical protein